jgi:hypothetical protein
MRNLPEFESYSQNTTDNWNCLKFYLPNITIWYSYHTPVAFKKIGGDLVVRKNDWNVTTGKHLNWIDGGYKESRIDGAEFERLLESALE